MLRHLTRHFIAAIIVLGAMLSGMFIYPADLDAAIAHSTEVHFINLIWGLYYGVGFEPANIWYRIYGPYRAGFVDGFGLIYYPLIASVFLYAVVVWLSSFWSRKRLLLVFGLSFLAIVPRPNLPMRDWWLMPLWINGAISEMESF
jgi:predicted membrane protein